MVFNAAFAGFLLLVDPLGGAPIFLSLTKECSAAAQVALAMRATLIASSILLVFILLGKSVFDYFGIMPAVFKVAGGTMLFSFSTKLIGNNSDTANKIIRTGDEEQEQIPAAQIDEIPVHDESMAKGPDQTLPEEGTSCKKLCHWIYSLPAALRSSQVQMEVREKTACIIFPMAMPLMAGPGAIAFAVLITELAREEAKSMPGVGVLPLLEVVLALVAVMVLCLLAFASSRLFVSRLGETFSRVATVDIGSTSPAFCCMHSYSNKGYRLASVGSD